MVIVIAGVNAAPFNALTNTLNNFCSLHRGNETPGRGFDNRFEGIPALKKIDC